MVSEANNICKTKFIRDLVQHTRCFSCPLEGRERVAYEFLSCAVIAKTKRVSNSWVGVNQPRQNALPPPRKAKVAHKLVCFRVCSLCSPLVPVSPATLAKPNSYADPPLKGAGKVPSYTCTRSRARPSPVMTLSCRGRRDAPG